MISDNSEQDQFITDNRWAVLTSLRADGQPVSSVVAYARDGDSLVISTPGGTFKRRSLERDGRATLCILPNAEPFNFVSVEGRVAVEHTVPFVFVAYALVFVWYLHHGKPARDVSRARKNRPWDSRKTEPSYADMLAALRREFWVWRISRYPSLRVVRRNLARLIAAWLPAA